jgi:hypothetical protein
MSEAEECYWCGHIKSDSTESMAITGWCSKHHKRVDMEQESCEDFVCGVLIPKEGHKR